MSIILEKRIGNTTVSTKRGKKTRGIWRGSQRGSNGRYSTLRATSQFTMPGLEVFLILVREMLENDDDGESKTNKPVEK